MIRILIFLGMMSFALALLIHAEMELKKCKQVAEYCCLSDPFVRVGE